MTSFVAPIVEHMISIVTEKKFLLDIWDLALCDGMEGKPSYSYNVMSDTDIIAIWALAKATGCPESEMIVNNSGTIEDSIFGMELAFYRFSPLE